MLKITVGGAIFNIFALSNLSIIRKNSTACICAATRSSGTSRSQPGLTISMYPAIRRSKSPSKILAADGSSSKLISTKCSKFSKNRRMAPVLRPALRPKAKELFRRLYKANRKGKRFAFGAEQRLIVQYPIPAITKKARNYS